MNQKGVSTTLIILIIVWVLVIGGLFWYYQKTLQIISEPAPQVTPADKTADFTPSEVEGWQTYRNEQYKYEINYPAKWELDETNNAQVTFSPNIKRIYQDRTGASLSITIVKPYKNYQDLERIMTLSIKGAQKLNPKFEAKVDKTSNQGLEGIKMIGPYMDDNGNFKNGFAGFGYFSIDSIKETLRIDYGCTIYVNCDQYKNTFDQMIATFKFVD